MFGEAFNRFPIQERTLTTLIRDGAERFGGRDFLSFADSGYRPLHFDEMPDLTARVAGGLAQLGIERGDIMVTLLENCQELVTACWGQAWLGGVSAPMNPGLRGEMLQRLLTHSRAKVVVTTGAGVATLQPLAGQLPDLQAVVVVGEQPESSLPTGVRLVPWEEVVSAPAAPAAEVRFSDPLMVLYTSGTTGGSKGVVIPHHYFYCWGVPLVDRLNWSTSDHLFTPMPLYHIGAQTCALIAGLAAGSRVSFGARFSASAFWQELIDLGATHVMVIGSMTAILMKQTPTPKERQHSLKTFWCAPTPVEPAELEERFGVHLIYQGYGMTETYPASVTYEQAPRGRSCVGKATELYDLKLVDHEDVDVPADGESPGEIVVRPRLPSAMMTEYLHDPEATAKAFRNLWFHTGDLAKMDSDGYLYLLGRKTDTIRRRGENISATELEQTAVEHPAVQQAAAFGVPSDLGEEDVKLDVVLAPDQQLDPEALITFLADRLPPHMVPRYLQFRDAFPMTPTQRVEKYRLRAQGAENATLDRGEHARNPTT